MTNSTVHPTVLAALTSTGIPHYPPSHPEYAGFQATWGSHAGQPSVIVRPQTATQVADIVSACLASKSEFVVRSGGHDLAGRSMIAGVVQIDLRLVKEVIVAEDKKTAWIGGGASLADVVAGLAPDGLITP